MEELLKLLLSQGPVAAGIVLAYLLFRRTQEAYDARWQAMHEEQSVLIQDTNRVLTELVLLIKQMHEREFGRRTNWDRDHPAGD